MPAKTEYIIQRPGTKNLSYKQRIPANLKSRLLGRSLMYPVGTETSKQTISKGTQAFTFSLHTSDWRVAELRAAQARAYILSYIDALHGDQELTLTYPQQLAIAGELYRVWARGPAADRNLTYDLDTKSFHEGPIPGEEGVDAGVLEQQADHIEEYLDNEDYEFLNVTYGYITRELLAEHGLFGLSDATRESLLAAMARYHAKALRQSARIWRGEPLEDKLAESLPNFEDVSPVPIMALFDGWWQEAEAAGRSVATKETYASTIKNLIEYLKHDNAREVTTKDIIGFKDMRLKTVNPRTGKTIAPKTVMTQDLAAIKTIFGWAVSNGRLRANPATGVKVQATRRTKVRERDFTTEEALSILKASCGVTSPSSLIELAYRWVPWLCAYTGCRVGEVLQLRHEDVRRDAESGIVSIRITPEAGTVKTKQYRDVPIHKHLLEQGFMDQCVNNKLSVGEAGLFLDVRPGATHRGTWKSRKNRMVEFVRKVVTDPNVSPNHAWRHTFKSVGFEAGIQEKVLDAICGHSPAYTGRAYGTVTLKTMADAMEMFPRWAVRCPSNGE